MALYLSEEELTYEVSGCTFKYERLVRDDLSKLRYLANIRGQFSDEMYNKACVATALRGWEGLAGKDGPIPWPLELPASAISDADQATVTQLAALVPTLTREQRMQLHGAFFVVSRLPIDVASALENKVTELSPPALEKKFSEIFNGELRSSTPPLATNLVVPIAGESNEAGSHAILAES